MNKFIPLREKRTKIPKGAFMFEGGRRANWVGGGGVIFWYAMLIDLYVILIRYKSHTDRQTD